MWDEGFVQMVLKMLSHHTPPSCIPPVFLTIVNSLYNDPRVNAVRQLPSVQTVWEWRSVLVVVSKTLAACQLGRADSYKQLFTDGTSWRQTAIQNAVMGILTDGGFKMVTLSSGILAENESAKCLTGSIDWCHGEVILVNGDKIKYATIRWDEDCLRPGDCSTTRE